MVRFSADDVDVGVAAIALSGLRVGDWLEGELLGGDGVPKAVLPRPTRAAAQFATSAAADALMRLASRLPDTRDDGSARDGPSTQPSASRHPALAQASTRRPPPRSFVADLTDGDAAADAACAALRAELEREDADAERERGERQRERERRAASAADAAARAQAEQARREAAERADAARAETAARARQALAAATASREPAQLERAVGDARTSGYDGPELEAARALATQLRDALGAKARALLAQARAGADGGVPSDEQAAAAAAAADGAADAQLAAEARRLADALRALAAAQRPPASSAAQLESALTEVLNLGCADVHTLVVGARAALASAALPAAPEHPAAGTGIAVSAPLLGLAPPAATAAAVTATAATTATATAGAAGVISRSSEQQLLADYDEALALVGACDATFAGATIAASSELGRCHRELGLRVNQVARVHKVVFERSGQIVNALQRTAAPDLVAAAPSRAGALALAVPAHVAYLARRVVTQGGVLIETQPKAAVPLALVIAGAASALPPALGGALWRALLAELNVACCYTVPCFPPRREGQSLDDWKLALGYKPLGPAGGQSGGALRLEPKDKYYNRVQGYVTLFAALLGAEASIDFDLGCACVDRGPHEICSACGARATSRGSVRIARPDGGERTGMRAAWRWLARLLNLPVRRITVVLLGPFLDTLGALLHAAFGRQFVKMLDHVANVFVPKVRATDIQDEERGALSRLETVVDGLRATLRAGRTPETHENLLMPLFKEQDDTRDEGGDGGDW